MKRGLIVPHYMTTKWGCGYAKARFQLNHFLYGGTTHLMIALAEPIQGDIGQETLTQIVSRDELVPQRKRHPWLDIRTVSFRRPYQAGTSHTRITFCKLIDQLVGRPSACWKMDSEPVRQEAPRDRDFHGSCCRQRQPYGAEEVSAMALGADCTVILRFCNTTCRAPPLSLSRFTISRCWHIWGAPQYDCFLF